MPLIEELPVTTTQRTSHGWAYVPDVRPQQQAQPLGARNRGTARNQAGGKGDISAKQQKAIRTKLNELDKENYKDTTIPIPARSKDRAGKKITPNVRRILTYQRTFAHYLADEEAQLAQNGNATTLPVMPQTPTLARSATSRASTSKQTPMQPPPRPGSAKRTPTASAVTTPGLKLKRERSDSISTTTNPSGPRASNLDLSTPLQSPSDRDPSQPSPALPSINLLNPNNALDAKLEDEATSNPLLKSHPHLKPPSTRLLALLLSEPPLSYSAARAPPLEDHPHHPACRIARKPMRYFCSICGYWGKVKCKRCGERTCGLLECWDGHDGVCSVPAY